MGGLSCACAQNLPALSASLSLDVYPNPSPSGEFVIELRYPDPGETIEVKVFSLLGNEVYAVAVASEEGVFRGKIQLRHLPKGVYLIEARAGQEKVTRRISYI
jgi:hypothetical protein